MKNLKLKIIIYSWTPTFLNILFFHRLPTLPSLMFLMWWRLKGKRVACTKELSFFSTFLRFPSHLSIFNGLLEKMLWNFLTEVKAQLGIKTVQAVYWNKSCSRTKNQSLRNSKITVIWFKTRFSPTLIIKLKKLNFNSCTTNWQTIGSFLINHEDLRAVYVTSVQATAYFQSFATSSS